jgi:putative transposase
MYLTSKIILHPTLQQQATLEQLIEIYNSEVNECLKKFKANQRITWIPYTTLNRHLPWESKKEVIKEASKIFNDNIKRKADCGINFSFNGDYCKCHCDSFTLGSKLRLQVSQNSEMVVEYYADEYQKNLLASGYLTSLKISKVNKKWICYIKILKPDPQPFGEFAMGVDLGIKVPAVAVTSSGKIKFFGNGRQIRFICTHQTSRLSKLMKEKRFKLIRMMNQKWGNKLRSIDHQISKAIIDFALKENIKTIYLENLNLIQKKTNTSRRISTWSYIRLKSFIEYKACLNGIEVKVINPQNTSRKCPKCNKLNQSHQREYSCSCGYKNHRDIVGAINICNYSSRKSN